MQHIVQIQGVHKEYPLGKVTVHALRGVSLDIQTGDFVTIAGRSGSGKTTLLNQIGCVDVPTAGKVYIDGRCTLELTEKESEGVNGKHQNMLARRGTEHLMVANLC